MLCIVGKVGASRSALGGDAGLHCRQQPALQPARLPSSQATSDAASPPAQPGIQPASQPARTSHPANQLSNQSAKHLLQVRDTLQLASSIQ